MLKKKYINCKLCKFRLEAWIYYEVKNIGFSKINDRINLMS